VPTRCQRDRTRRSSARIIFSVGPPLAPGPPLARQGRRSCQDRSSVVEASELAAALIERIRREAGDVDLRGWVLHADNGGPMKGATMLATLQRLGVVPSFSRPSVSDDNPYSEALFRTLKYCPEYPSTGLRRHTDKTP
jgi:hypothetical protein